MTSSGVVSWRLTVSGGVLTSAEGGNHVDRVALPTPGAPGVGSFGRGAAMRRSTVVAVLGGVAAVGAGAFYGLVQRGIVSDKHVAGIAVSRAAIGAAVVGVVLLAGGLLFTWRQRRAEAAYEAELEDEAPEPYVWPTIVVRHHGRPRQRPSARIVTVPPSTWPVPSPRHPSMAGSDASTTFPTPGEGWLPDNVQRLPFRG
jgi:hypothetical protein